MVYNHPVAPPFTGASVSTVWHDGAWYNVDQYGRKLAIIRNDGAFSILIDAKWLGKNARNIRGWGVYFLVEIDRISRAPGIVIKGRQVER